MDATDRTSTTVRPRPTSNQQCCLMLPPIRKTRKDSNINNIYSNSFVYTRLDWFALARPLFAHLKDSTTSSRWCLACETSRLDVSLSPMYLKIRYDMSQAPVIFVTIWSPQLQMLTSNTFYHWLGHLTPSRCDLLHLGRISTQHQYGCSPNIRYLDQSLQLYVAGSILGSLTKTSFVPTPHLYLQKSVIHNYRLVP